jgi:hypothetical protein
VASSLKAAEEEERWRAELSEVSSTNAMDLHFPILPAVLLESTSLSFRLASIKAEERCWAEHSEVSSTHVSEVSTHVMDLHFPFLLVVLLESATQSFGLASSLKAKEEEGC